MARTKKDSAKNRFVMAAGSDVASLTEVPILAGRNNISPPPDSGDPSGPSRDRYRDRQKK